MHSNIWGPPAWYFLHSVTLNYPDNPTYIDQQNYKQFFHSLEYILPCKKCALNYKKNMEEIPIDDFLSSKDLLIEWLINIHNKVNYELNKPIYNTNDMYNFINNYRLYNLSFTNILIILLIIVILSSIIYKIIYIYK